MFRAADRMGRVQCDHLADDEPIEQQAHRGEVLFDGRLLMRRPERLEIRADMEWLDLNQILDPLGVAPGEEVRAGAAVGGARVVVLDCAEEIGIAARGFVAGVGDELRHDDRPAECFRGRRHRLGALQRRAGFRGDERRGLSILVHAG